MSQSSLDALREFHLAMGLDAPERYTQPQQSAQARVGQAILSEALAGLSESLKSLGAIHDNDVTFLRFRLIVEELAEVSEALLDGDPRQVLWEVCDLIYVVSGLAVTLGLDRAVPEAFQRIHEANMSKLDDDGNPVREPGGKIIKGPNYQKADLSDIEL